jgi:hypothetical protein
VPTAAGTSSPAPVATPQYVCTAVHLGVTGQWSQAEEHWITNETRPDNLAATMAFLQLGEDAGAVALDQLQHLPMASDIVTYTTDLAGDGAYTVGC